MKVDFKKQNVCTFENFMSPRDSPRLTFCVLWRNYAYRTQDARLKKSLYKCPLSNEHPLTFYRKLSRSSQLPSGPLMQLSSLLRKQPPFMFLTVHRGLLMLLTLSGRGRLSHPPNRSTTQSKKTPDLYTEEEGKRWLNPIQNGFKTLKFWYTTDVI